MNTKKYRYQATAAALAVGMFTTSCGTMSDETWTQIQTTLIGAAGGAGVGVLTQVATGGDIKTGALIGAAIGALAGVVWGASIVKEKKAYATAEEYVNANNQQLKRRIEETRAYNAKLKTQVDELKKENKRLSNEDKAKVKATVDKGVKAINDDIATAKSARADAKGEDLAMLNTNIATLQKEKAAMEADLARL